MTQLQLKRSIFIGAVIIAILSTILIIQSIRLSIMIDSLYAIKEVIFSV